MKLMAEITIGSDGTLSYAGSLSADNEPLNEAVSMQLAILTETHKAIKEAVGKVNDSLTKEITDKLAIPNCDEYGNVTYLSIKSV